MKTLKFLHTIDEILFANIDVTSSVLAFLLVNLARNTAAQTRLRAEILANATSPEAYVQKTDTLLEHTCMESIRLCPAACKSSFLSRKRTITSWKTYGVGKQGFLFLSVPHLT